MNRYICVGLLAVAITVLAGVPQSAVGATYYVAPKGNDADPGTEAQPWATLRKAAASVQPGDTVRIKAGDYREPSGWNVTRAGTAEKPITYQAYGNGEVRITPASEVPAGAWTHVKGGIYSAPVRQRPAYVFQNAYPLHPPGDRGKIYAVDDMIPNSFFVNDTTLYVWLQDGSNPEDSVMRVASAHVVELRDCHYTIFDGLTVEYGFNGFKDQGKATHHVTYRNCTIRSIGSQGIQPVPQDSVIEKNLFQKIGSNKYLHGIYNSKPGLIVRHNVFEEIAGAAIHQFHEGSPAGGGCEFHDNIFRGARPMTTRPGTGRSPYYVEIIAWGEGNNRICNNVFYGEGKRGGISLNSFNNRVHHNTFAGSAYGIEFHTGKTGNQVTHNIFQDTTTSFLRWPAKALPQTLDYNVYYNAAAPPRWQRDGVTYDTFSAYQQAAGEVHSRYEEPRQINPPDAGPALGARATKSEPEKPYRVLVVIGDQWDDPGSYCIDTQSRFYQLRARKSGKDFVDVATMLKIWGIPFDILRLDQQRLQVNRFLNGVAEPNYRCVIWMADPDRLQGQSAHYETLRRVVEDYGIPLIALFDYIRAPEVAELVGVELVEGAAATAQGNAGLALRGEHFLTAGLVGTTLSGDGASKPRVVPCRPRRGTQVLGELQDQPQLVVRNVNEQTKAVWIGGGPDWFDKVPAMRQLFRQALVWCMDYGLFNDNFENAFIFVMDDMGCSEHAYSLAWHYPTPGKEDIIKYLVEPLAKEGRVMVQNLTPGYANPRTRMVENPWTVPTFTDPFGNVQDYGSTKEGLDEGVRRGVFEIHAHRAWTHLNWDLDSPPGPWWDAPLEGEQAHTDWYNETVDTRRGVPVPSNDQLFLYKIGRDAIERQFGVTPLGVTVRPGWGLEHDNGRLAAIAGYGVGRWHYLGPDRVIQFSILDMAPEEFSCHDLDLVEKTGPEFKTPTQAQRERNPAVYRSTRVVGGRVIDLRDPNWPDRWKHKRWIGFNEYCAYLHSRIEIPATAGGLTFDIDYDTHYCRHFARHPSQWTLELSEDYRRNSGDAVSVLVDGKTVQPVVARRTAITIPPGVGRHRVQVRARKGNE